MRKILLLAVLLAGCTSNKKLSLAPAKNFDADNKNIEKPQEIEENQIWDIVDHTLFFQIRRYLDLAYTTRQFGRLVTLGAIPPKQADNVNKFDEVPNSSWYTQRHFHKSMTLEELAKGADTTKEPSQDGKWEIVGGKFEGGTAGFTIKDAKGDRYILKFDSKGNTEMGSASEVIATKILYACGYNVPQNQVVYFEPSIFVIGEKATVPTPDKQKRKMTQEDLEKILKNIEPTKDGKLRCVASKFLSGKPVGVFNYDGRRKDDLNDKVDHENRRELRALQVIGSWLNDADRRAANTLDMFVTDEKGNSYVKHYLIDFGSCLGSNNLFPHPPKYGNEYVWDAGTIGKSILGLGFYKKSWEEPQKMKYASLGYFENKTFNPAAWYPTYPNPAMELCTNSDAFWGAKIVMSFSDEAVATFVQQGKYSNPEAEQEMTRLLIERRDLIGKYWFTQVNPLDKFEISGNIFSFVDLAVLGKLEDPNQTSYEYFLIDGNSSKLSQKMFSNQTSWKIPSSCEQNKFYGFEIRTQRNKKLSKWLKIYFGYKDGKWILAKIEREN
ncbi:hypothetical protein IT568_01895 [bacterium]|nr:hypothetical protein [bacterium]